MFKVFNQFKEFSNFLLDTSLRDINYLIFKVSIFPNASVLEGTALFLELHLLLTLRVVQRGYSSYLKYPEYILSSSRRQFYNSNSSKVDQLWYPFGDHLGEHADFSAWVKTLQVGDKIDAVKYCKHEHRAIWSRATILEVSLHKVLIQFVGEHSKIYHNRTLDLTPFLINQLGSRSLDWDWRENLKHGDQVDVFFGRKGWLLLEVKEIDFKVNDETGEPNILAWCQLSSEADDSELYSSDEEVARFGSRQSDDKRLLLMSTIPTSADPIPLARSGSSVSTIQAMRFTYVCLTLGNWSRRLPRNCSR